MKLGELELESPYTEYLTSLTGDYLRHAAGRTIHDVVKKASDILDRVSIPIMPDARALTRFQGLKVSPIN